MQTVVPLDESKLTAESKEFAQWLFQWRPDWRTYAGMIAKENSPEFDLEVRIPSPTLKTERDLVLGMADDPSIFFGNWHSHLSLFGTSDEDAIDDFKMFVAGILADELVCCFDPKAQAASLIGPTETDEILDILTSPHGSGRCEVTSFNGTADQVLSVKDAEKLAKKTP